MSNLESGSFDPLDPSQIASQRVQDNDDFAIYDKPANVSMLADRQGTPCLWDAIKRVQQPAHLVHRLDKGTSGVLIVAKSRDMRRALNRGFNEHRIAKFYLAWVVGHPPSDATHHIDLPLTKGRKSRYRIAGARANIELKNKRYDVEADRPGHAANTRFRVLRQTEQHSLLVLQPKSGRTHQLRVHLSWIGYPIVGDSLYGQPDAPLQQASRLLLHCHKMTFQNAPTPLHACIAPGADFTLES